MTGAAASKRCSGCGAPGELLPAAAFARNRARADGLQEHCRACRRAVDARRYREHGPTQRRQIRAAELHHTAGKEMDLNRLLAGGCSWPRMQAELARGVILCANCHRRREASARGFWRAQFRLARLEKRPPAQ